MGGFYASDVKNILYILPVLSGFICAILVRLINNNSSNVVVNKEREWAGTNLFGGKSDGGPMSLVQQDDELINDKNIGLVIEYNDTALEAHAKKAKISGNSTAIKKSIGDMLTKHGLRPASGVKGGEKSQIMFSGNIEKMKKAVWQIRENMSWLRRIPNNDDVAVAYTVQQVGRGMKTKIKFEPCPILFNQE